MSVRGIRGATTISEDTPDAILLATRELLLAIQEANPTLQPNDIASILFTVTHDVHSAYPAQAAREMGMEEVPLMCAQEIAVPGSLERCIRILMIWNTNLTQKEIHHIYLHEAVRLRPDLVQTSS